MNQRRIILRYWGLGGGSSIIGLWAESHAGKETCLEPGFCWVVHGLAAFGVNVVGCMVDSRRLQCLSHCGERTGTDDPAVALGGPAPGP